MSIFLSESRMTDMKKLLGYCIIFGAHLDGLALHRISSVHFVGDILILYPECLPGLVQAPERVWLHDISVASSSPVRSVFLRDQTREHRSTSLSLRTETRYYSRR